MEPTDEFGQFALGIGTSGEYPSSLLLGGLPRVLDAGDMLCRVCGVAFGPGVLALLRLTVFLARKDVVRWFP
jgi:hypothetical protein